MGNPGHSYVGSASALPDIRKYKMSNSLTFFDFGFALNSVHQLYTLCVTFEVCIRSRRWESGMHQTLGKGLSPQKPTISLYVTVPTSGSFWRCYAPVCKKSFTPIKKEPNKRVKNSSNKKGFVGMGGHVLRTTSLSFEQLTFASTMT